MRTLLRLCLLSVVLATPMALATDATPLPDGLAAQNVREAEPGVLAGGTPTSRDLTRLKAAGYRSVINLEGLDDNSLSEAAVAEKLGLQYIALPISAVDVTRENAIRLDDALKLAGTPVYVHCASGNRVGALMALRAYFVGNMSPAAALEAGRKAGLTNLADRVSGIIADAEAEKAAERE